MGNFYTNVVVRSSDADRAVKVLESQKRTAYVASVDEMTFVYDEKCEDQNVKDLMALARLLSKGTGAPALAALNHDDDVLWLALAEGDSVTNIYNSYPAFSDEGSDEPMVRDIARLCAAFGVPERAAEVETLLAASHEEVLFEIGRHEKLLELLEVSAIGLTGYNYVYEDGLPEEGVAIRATGGAPLPS